MRHAVIDSKTHVVKNVIIWDGVSKWSPPADTYVIRHDKCDINDTYDAKKKAFIKPQRPAE
jgi:hypothetical protein